MRDAGIPTSSSIFTDCAGQPCSTLRIFKGKMRLKKLETCLSLSQVSLMTTITVTQARQQLGDYLKRAAAGEEIGIMSGTDIISLRKVGEARGDQKAVLKSRKYPPVLENPYELETFDGGAVDAAANHDHYLYDRRPDPSRE
ncbi:MAG: type II toxin-antitoxin system Phd/YefM family antitoxin [Luteolibacter sp.]